MKSLRYVFSFCLLLAVIVLASNPAAASPGVSTGAGDITPAQPFTTPQTCHFGIAAVPPFTSYDFSTLGVGSYVDFTRNRNSSVPANIDFYRVVYIGGSVTSYNSLKNALPSILAQNPGSTWIVGNEPDSEVTYQDHMAADFYATRFFEIATIIRTNDPAAKIGFGAIIQATPVRLYWLTLAMNKLVQLAGSVSAAHALIDFYPIHSYILNEQTPLYDSNGKMIMWGAGVPVGYVAGVWPAPQEIHTELSSAR